MTSPYTGFDSARANLTDSTPGGLGSSGLKWAPTGFGRGLYGVGIALMIVGAWMGFATYTHTNLIWDAIPSVEVPIPTSASARPLTDQPGVNIPVPNAGPYYVLVYDDVDIANRATTDKTADYDTVSHTPMRVSVEQHPIEATGSGGDWTVRASRRFSSHANSKVLTYYAVPANDAPNEVHWPTFQRDLVIFVVGFGLFVVGFTRRHHYVKALKAQAKAIDASLEATRAPADDEPMPR